ncbi:amphi-Trp domain-containing protein [Desulfovibrio sp. OttesenSCG-928-M14]|nr:amphi-Trp domain-containing protein [Desulfovibrio sp. OttesenSCG-928-M14]
MEAKKLEFSTRLTREDVAGLIEALVEGLKDGLLKVQKSNEVLEMQVPRVVDLEIEAEIDDEHAEFEIEISWRTNRAENPDILPDDPAPKVAKTGKIKDSQKIAATVKKTSKSPGAKTTGTTKKAAGAKAKPAAARQKKTE